MTTYTSTVHVDVPSDFAFAQVVELMMASSGGMHCTVLDAPPVGLGTRFRYEYRPLGLAIGGTCTLTEFVPGEKVTFAWHGPERFAFGGLRGEWTFAPDEGGATVTVHSVYDTRVPILHPLAARVMTWSFRKSELPALKTQMEARFREAQPAS